MITRRDDKHAENGNRITLEKRCAPNANLYVFLLGWCPSFREGWPSSGSTSRNNWNCCLSPSPSSVHGLIASPSPKSINLKLGDGDSGWSEVVGVSRWPVLFRVKMNRKPVRCAHANLHGGSFHRIRKSDSSKWPKTFSDIPCGQLEEGHLSGGPRRFRSVEQRP